MKRIGLFALTVVMALSLAACTTPKTPNGDKGNNGGDNTVVDPIQKEETKTIKLYFANEEYIATGDESLEHLIGKDLEVKVGEKSIAEVVLEELQKKPEDENLSTMVGKLKILSVEVKEGIAYVDLSSENLNGGSLEESMILGQIVLSLTELEEVDAVQFLIDGAKGETLMGHTMIEEPIKRAELE